MVLWALLASAGGVGAQAALVATSVAQDRLPPNSRLTLRPGRGFERLAVRVARVLALRGNTTVEIGDPAPTADELLDIDTVAAGHVVLAAGQPSGSAHLVLGAAMGTSYDATIALSPDGEEDARVLALAIEALRDRAIAMRERYEAEESARVGATSSLDASAGVDGVDGVEGAARRAGDLELVALELNNTNGITQARAGVDAALSRTAAETADAVGAALASPSAPGSPQRAEPIVSANPYQLDLRDDDELFPRSDPSERVMKVKPRLYLGFYGGASSESRALRTGVTTGGGLCVRGQCLLLGLEYPLPISLEQGADDVRYRYPTFSCTFHSQPFELGRFAPAVSFGVLSRVGHFERDMGLKDSVAGLDSDLGIRGTVEGAFEVVEAVDVVAQAGFDYALDRWQYGNTSRGSRTAPWLQAGIRIRPE